jgi:hypothetical protein
MQKMMSRKYLLLAVPAIMLFWFGAAAMNFAVGLGYGNNAPIVTILGISLTSAIIFGFISLSADVLGSSMLYAASWARQNRLWFAMAFSVVLGGACIAWTLHSSHRFISIAVKGAEAPATNDKLLLSSLRNQLSSAEERYESAMWSPVPASDAAKDRRLKTIAEAKTAVADARKNLTDYEGKAHVSALSGIEWFFAVFVTGVAAFGPYAFFPSRRQLVASLITSPTSTPAPAVPLALAQLTSTSPDDTPKGGVEHPKGPYLQSAKGVVIMPLTSVYGQAAAMQPQFAYQFTGAAAALSFRGDAVTVADAKLLVEQVQGDVKETKAARSKADLAGRSTQARNFPGLKLVHSEAGNDFLFDASYEGTIVTSDSNLLDDGSDTDDRPYINEVVKICATRGIMMTEGHVGVYHFMQWCTREAPVDAHAVSFADAQEAYNRFAVANGFVTVMSHVNFSSYTRLFGWRKQSTKTKGRVTMLGREITSFLAPEIIVMTNEDVSFDGGSVDRVAA